jgi:hypothetical protein
MINLVQQLQARVSELLQFNNEFEERARVAERRVKELETALKPFSDLARRFGDTAREDGWEITRNPSGKDNLTMGDCRDALRVLLRNAA